MEMLSAIHEKMGKTLVIITHDNRMAGMADRRFSIVDGILTEVGGR
jgi:putative ABC transport system ATP-binding protein